MSTKWGISSPKFRIVGRKFPNKNFFFRRAQIWGGVIVPLSLLTRLLTSDDSLTHAPILLYGSGPDGFFSLRSRSGLVGILQLSVWWVSSDKNDAWSALINGL